MSRILSFLIIISIAVKDFFPKNSYNLGLFLLVIISLIAGTSKNLRFLFPASLFFLLAQLDLIPTFLHGLPIIPLLLPLMSIVLMFTILKGRFMPQSWLKETFPVIGTWNYFRLGFGISTAIISALALIIWANSTQQLGAGAQMVKVLNELPSWAIVITILCFALFNATTEEFIYRGLLQNSLKKAFQENSKIPIFLSSFVFATLHFQMGFPNGLIGLLMVFIYGLALGFLKQQSRGLSLPIITHFFADIVIATYLLFSIK